MVNNAANIIIESESVIYANSLPEAQEYFLSDYEIEYWEKHDGNGVKFASLMGQEKNDVMTWIFREGEIFEIKVSEIKKIN